MHSVIENSQVKQRKKTLKVKIPLGVTESALKVKAVPDNLGDQTATYTDIFP
jgi:hypothetical protein